MTIKLNNISKFTVKLIVFLLIFVAINMIVNKQEALALRNELPNTEFIYGPNADSVHIGTYEKGNWLNLDAKVTWAKLSFPGGETNFSISIFDGCADNTYPDFGPAMTDWSLPSWHLNFSRNDLICNLPANLTNSTEIASYYEFFFCASNPDGTRRYNQISQMRTDFLNGVYQGLPGNCYAINASNMVKNNWFTFNISSLISPPVVASNGTKNFIMAAHFGYYNDTDPSLSSYSGIGIDRVNSFKVRANHTQAVVGYVAGPNTSEPIALQNRILDTTINNDFDLPFAVPCNLPSIPTINIRWNDADIGGQINPSGELSTPNDFGVAFEMINVTVEPDSYIASTTLAANLGLSHQNFIGGQNEYKEYGYSSLNFPINIVGGHLYVWRWKDILNTNGLQFWIPFDTREFYGPSGCFDNVACTVQVLESAFAGEPFKVSFSVSNGTGVSIKSSDGWRLGANLASRDNSGTNNYLANAYDAWARIDIPSGDIPFGHIQSFEKVFYANSRGTPTGEFNPDSASYGPELAAGIYDFEWRFVREGYGWFGPKCTTQVKVNAYNLSCSIQINSEVYSGEIFSANIIVNNADPAPLLGSDGWRIGANLATQDSSGTENFLAPDTTRWLRIQSPTGIFVANGQTIIPGVQFYAKNRSSSTGVLTANSNAPNILAYGTDLPLGTQQFELRMVREGKKWYGQKCSTTLNVKPLPPSCPTASETKVLINGNNSASIASGIKSKVSVRIKTSAGQNITPINGNISIITSTPNTTNKPIVFGPVAGSNVFMEATLTDPPEGVDFPILGSVTIRWTFAGSAAECNATLSIHNAPFFKVYGNDISAGGNWCSAGVNGAATATIKGFAPLIDSNNARGASTEFGAFAQGSINPDYFFGASLKANRSATISPKDLTFANTNNTHWGGEFTSSGRCIPDYFNATRNNNIQTLTPVNNIVTLTNTAGQYRIPAGFDYVTVQPPVGGINSQITIYSESNVFINQDFNYNLNIANTIKTMPYFTLITNNSVFIASNVSKFDGFIVAQPQSGNGPTQVKSGRILTCVANVGGKPVAVLSANMYDTCYNKLTLNGAMIAKKIYVLRTIGNSYGSTPREKIGNSNVAEEFNFSPSDYVGIPNLKSTTNAGAYDSFSNLPPIF